MKKISLAGKPSPAWWMFLCLWLTQVTVLAQNPPDQKRTITGMVTDRASRQPIPGATVAIKGTTQGVAANNEGRFSISAKTGDILLVSFIGMTSQEIRIGSASTYNVSLQTDSKTLDDVVVVGYGKMKKTDQSSAQVSVSAADIGRTVNTTIDQALQGRAAGVYVTQNSGQPGGGVSVVIRGVNTLSGTNEPLYVIDGVQIQPATVSYGNTSSMNPLAGINSNDIESMEILQGPSATAIYGSRATNGVVLVTTRRGRQGQMKVGYNYMYTLQDKPTEVATLNLRQYAIMNNEIAALLGRTPTPEFANPSVLGDGTRWQKELFKTAPLQRHQLTVSGGTERTGYYLSGEYFDQDGVAVGSDFKRYSFRLNMDNKLFKWLTLNTSVNFYQTKEKLSSTSEDVIRNAINLAPNVPVKNPDGSWGGATENEFGTNARYAPLNPVAIANLISNNLKRTGGMGGLSAEVNIIKGLTFRTSFNGNFEYFDGVKFTPTYRLGFNVNEKASMSVQNNRNFYWNLNELLQYNTNIGKHAINAMASHEAQAWNNEGYSITRVGFASNEIPSINLGDAQGQTTGGFKGSGALESWLGRVIYTYDEKYILQVAGRADGSSNFGANNRWGYFPSASAAWRISREPFMQAVPVISDLKLRAEWGTTGNSGSGGAQFSSLSSVTTPWGAGFRTGQYGNADLKWESTETKNIGLNIGLLKDRIQIEADYYVRKTDNLLMPNPLPAYMGTQGEGAISAPIVNIGSMENKGFGVTLNTTNINRNNFTWKTNFNISSFRTKITKFYSDAAFLSRSAWYMNNFTARSSLGQAPWMFWGYVAEGVFQSEDEIHKSPIPTQSDGSPLPIQKDGGVWVGDIKYKDLNGDKKIDSRDQTFIGNPWPKLTFGLTNSFSWKGFDLSILLTGASGNDIYNYVRYSNSNPNNINLGRNLMSEAFDYARIVQDGSGKDVLSNPGTSVPRIVGTDVNGNGNRFTNLFVEDGSYIRIKNVTLGYVLPSEWLSRQRVVRSVRFSIGAQNLHTFTKYSGFDPEVGAYLGKEVQLNSQLIAVDAGRYPLTRMYNAAVAVDF
ncbi:SusC/RagA family TonB-linked outer membrane protein [Chitinophaga rhizosphaerae]|uniref:SusC/RagA family TonB-linked outer membrane protein n=1 Tax=Chitinophaga rhizosphaerae TaxID=1864947 RepID=UPI00196AD277|nr:TonB-dependent receptor [Chitinophaga rhizosphaerae]